MYIYIYTSVCVSACAWLTCLTKIVAETPGRGEQPGVRRPAPFGVKKAPLKGGQAWGSFKREIQGSYKKMGLL